jgi:hypothetical protein
MKKTLSFILALMLLLPVFALGESAENGSVFDKTVLEKSHLYSYDKFAKKWQIDGKYLKNYRDSRVEVLFLLFDSYVENQLGPEIRVVCFDKENETYNTVLSFRAFVDDTLFSIEKLNGRDTYSNAFGASGIQAFADALVNAKEVAFQINFIDKFGESWTLTIDPVDVSELNELKEISKVFKESNAWTTVSNPKEYDAIYGISIE